ncbi:hypothetical protein J45TS6_22230 [Paenibacillus sp. J45TS6]|uniref:DUF342 domain-containing protein n=1 Tax=Paenibacillus sp. J45TS6 TaxID=2807196 RepID=UPI001B2E2CDC|nr:FapA family protein [Paenibacillus sp. J45TS6]GIP43764.1 hypothetical protein J45TS6_22230 [Paenibacillus sp. J45TS6]
MTQKIELKQHVKVLLSDDQSSAWIDLSNLTSELDFTEQELNTFLLTEGIAYGIKTDTIRAIAASPLNFYGQKILIAEGDVPEAGKDGIIQFLTSTDLTGERRPLETGNGRVDYKEITRLNNVKKGQVIAKKIDPSPGKPGKSVKGDLIPFSPGKEARFKTGKNVVVSTEGNAMYASIDGLITTTENHRINVFPVFEVNGDVDYKTGNIDFVGTVVIRGNVLSGFKVKAAGDIRVIGGVEGAEVFAEGSIEVTGGIIGYNKGLIQAGVDVKSSFIQDANVEAGQCIYVSQSIMHSSIRAGKECICAGTKGLIVGGLIQAGERVAARVVGNPMSTVTTIEVGVMPRLRNELTNLRQQQKGLSESIDKTAKALHLLDQMAATGHISDDKMHMRMKLQVTRESSMQQMKENREQILDIEKVLEDTSKARVDITKMIYGGSKIVIGRYTKFIKDTATQISFFYQNGDISMVPLKNG